MRQRLNIIRCERINVNGASGSSWRSRKDVRVGREVRTERICLHLNPVLRHGRPSQDAERAPVEDTVSTARNDAARLIQLVGKSKTRGPVIVVRIDPAGVDSNRRQSRIRILYLWIVITEQIISNAIIEGQAIGGAPGVLYVKSDFVRVRVCEWPICSSSGEPLRKCRGSPSGKVRIAVELKGSAEVTGKEIVDFSNIQIESELVVVRTSVVRQTFDKLIGFGVRIARAEIIPPDLHHQCSCLANLRLRRAGIRRTGLVVAYPAESGFE